MLVMQVQYHPLRHDGTDGPREEFQPLVQTVQERCIPLHPYVPLHGAMVVHGATPLSPSCHGTG